MTTIPTTTLAPGLEISRIVTGLWQIADMERDGTLPDFLPLANSMKDYAARGFYSFDMADHYGSAEDICGVYRQHFMQEQPIHAFTKWVPKPGAMTREKVREAIQVSLNRLQTEQIDLLQFHAWHYPDPNWLEALFLLQELKEEGLIKHLGLTNFDTAHLQVVVESGIEVVSNQVCFSLLDMRAAGAMSDYCLKSGVRLLAFGTLAGGLLSERWLDQPEPDVTDSTLTWSQMKYKRFIDVAGGWGAFQALLISLDELAKAKNTSIANLATRFILEHPAVGAVIIGARLGENNHSERNARMFSFSWTNEDQKTIKTALKSFNAIPGDCGDEYRKPPFLTASGDLSHHFDEFPSPYPTVTGSDGRTKALSGTVWEDVAGFSRAVRKGNLISISGTTATLGDRAIGGQDPAAQTHFVIDKLEGALQALGSKLEDVTRTRIFIKNLEDWEAIARAHGQRFGDIQPANTMVRADLIGDEYLVEIEAEAQVD